MDDARDFWNKQTTSLHRFGSEDFYRNKADEHASLVPASLKQAGCVDLGCGAGELLYFFSDLVRVNAGLDYSSSMLKEAEKRLAGKTIELSSRDIFDYLPAADEPVWTTTGAINQYLPPDQVARFIDTFVQNQRAQALYLFDCVDPLRIALLPYGSSYVLRSRGTSASGTMRAGYVLARRILTAARLAFGFYGRASQKLRGAGMGYGYLPRFWLEAAAARGLDIEIVSSRFYEYRYHAILKKKPGLDRGR